MAKRETYIGLDIVRFCAAFIVAVYHLTYWGWLPEATPNPALPFASAFVPVAGWTRWGSIGVPIFFVLSGFIIAASANGRTWQGFARGRTLRLYPAVWLCAVPLCLVQAVSLPTLLRTLTLWPAGPWLSGVFWTLAVEITFYALVALTIALRVRLWTFGALFGSLGSLYWLARGVDFATGGHAKALFGAVETDFFGKLFILHSCFFGVGVALWALHEEGPTATKAALLAAFILAGVVEILSSARFSIASHGGAIHDIWRPAAIWLAAAALIAGSIRFQSAIWRRFGRWSGAFRTVGLATYPLYLLHYQVGQFVMVRSGLDPWPALAVALAAVLALAFVVVRLERWPRLVLAGLLAVRPKAQEPTPQLP